jgi:hypothetical protein
MSVSNRDLARIRRFVTVCQQHWPGSKICIRPDDPPAEGEDQPDWETRVRVARQKFTPIPGSEAKPDHPANQRNIKL